MLIMRTMQANHCTIGHLEYGDFYCFTLELPWRMNQPNRSCIPAGKYDYKLFDSTSKGRVLLLDDVPGRTWIEIHAGNYTKQIEGCIIVGDSLLDMNGDGVPDISNSKKTLMDLLSIAPPSGSILILR